MIPARLLEVPTVFPGAAAAVLVESVLYGAHIVLFCICTHILIRRKKRHQLALLLPVTVMFLLATADIAMSFNMLLADLPLTAHNDVVNRDLLARIYPKNPLYVTNNFLADVLLLYRCYMVWGKRGYVIIVPAILLIADTVWGYISIGTTIFSLGSFFSSLFLWSIFVFNLIITAATAGRIWWIARTTSKLLGKQVARRYHTAVAVLIESGAIYCIPLLMMLVVAHKRYSLIFQALSIRLVAIIPTLMIVQVELWGQGNDLGRDARPSEQFGKASVHSTSSTNVPSGSVLSDSQIFAEKSRDLEEDRVS